MDSHRSAWAASSDDEPLSAVIPIKVSARQFFDLEEICRERNTSPARIMEIMLAEHLEATELTKTRPPRIGAAFLILPRTWVRPFR